MTQSRRTTKATIGVGAIAIASFLLLILLELLNAQGRSARAAIGASIKIANAVGAHTGTLTPPLRLNEIMINNRSVISDQAGDFDNWIELYNVGLLPLDVGGMALNPGPLSPTQWLIPTDTVILPRDYLLIWADGEPHEGPLHTDFVLTAGQAISLLDKQVFDQALIDRLAVGSTSPDLSWARHPNGDGAWTLFERPSPGNLNAISWVFLPLVTRGGPQTEPNVFINEFLAANDNVLADEAGEYDDWIELYNPGPHDVDLGGMYLSDDLGDLPRWQIPPGTVISASGHLLFWADGQEDQGPLHTSFKLSRDGEMILLVNADGYSTLDSITFSAQQDDVSWGRMPDGADNWQAFTTPTPGAPNSQTPILISGTSHWPATPGVSDTVTVTARITAAFAPVTVTLVHDAWDALSQTLRLTQTIMLDDGAHGDGDADDGLYGAQSAPQPSQTVVRYYVQARDGLGRTTTDPLGAPDDTYGYTVDLPLEKLVINEFMAANGSVISDGDGDFDDWIELHNTGAITLDLGGYYLTDDLDDPTRWQVPPTTTLAAGDFLLIWADNEPDEGPLHTNFRLAASGEAVGLFGPDGLTVVDAVTFNQQTQDVSFGRYPDGTGAWQFLTTPTPGYPNVLSRAWKDGDVPFDAPGGTRRTRERDPR